MKKQDRFLHEIEEFSNEKKIETLIKEIDKQMLDNPESCHDWIVNLQEISQIEKDKNGFFYSQLYLGNYYHRTDDFEKGLDYAKRCLKIAKQNNQIIWEAESNLLLGKFFTRKGEYQKAIDVLEMAKNVFHSENDEEKESEAYFFMGEVYRLLGNFDESIEVYQKAITISEKLQKSLRLAFSHNNLGNVYFDFGLYEKALTHFLRALAIYEELSRRDLQYVSLCNVGNIYLRTEELEKAMDYYKKALQIIPAKKEAISYSQILNNIGALYFHLEKYDKAKKSYQKSLIIKREINDKKGVASIYNNLGEIAIKEKNDEEAFRFLEKSIEIKRELGLKTGLAQTLVNYAALKIMLKQIDDVLPMLEESEKLAEQTKSSVLLYQAYAEFANYYQYKHDYEKAYQYFKLSTELKEIVFSENSKKNISDLQSKYELEKKEKEKEIYRLKNIELAKANEAIQEKNEELNHHREHLRLINKILRHDLVNHLSTIQSSIRLFRGNRDWEMLMHIESSVKNSVQLIERMRDLETILISNKKLKPYQVKEILQEICKQYEHKINWEIEGEGNVLADEAIISLFENIVSNAIIHGKATGISISINPHKKYYEVRIADNGSGIPDKLKEKVFEESFSYGDKGNTGLGLFIVKKTIESYQGTVYIEDNVPAGAVFVLLFRRIK